MYVAAETSDTYFYQSSFIGVIRIEIWDGCTVTQLMINPALWALVPLGFPSDFPPLKLLGWEGIG